MPRFSACGQREQRRLAQSRPAPCRFTKKSLLRRRSGGPLLQKAREEAHPAGKINKRVPRSSSAWAGPFHHKRRKQSLQTGRRSQGYVVTMPWGLRRFQETGQLHFLTFSCYKGRPNFGNAPSRTTFETSLEQARQRCGLCVYGYVVVPEHIHMLVNEPEQGSLSQVMQSLKQSVPRTLALRAADPFWQARYHDFNVYDSTYGASTSLWRSSATFTGIR